MARYFLTLPDPTVARGAEPSLSFTAQSADVFASELEAALRTTTLFERWRDLQPDPEAIDVTLGAVDEKATVSGNQSSLSIDLEVDTELPGSIVRSRMRWLAGSNWQLRDVRN
ncbi:MAG: hypothetical protein ABIP49_09465 [Lysobacterales bacterium]